MSHVAISKTDSGNTSVVIDGIEVNNLIRSVTLHVDYREFPTVSVEYACVDGASFDGEAKVLHLCPVSGEATSEGVA